MDIIVWLGLGLVAGGVASRFLDDTVEETLFDIVLGVIGALFTGWILTSWGRKENVVDIFQVFTILLSGVIFILFRNNIKTQAK